MHAWVWRERSGLDGKLRLWQGLEQTLTTSATSVQNSSLRGFGLLIAYVLPGFTLLLGLSTLSPTLRLWLVGWEASNLAVGGVLYVTAASIIVGMVLNAVRWALIDSLHHATGLVRPAWNDALLSDRLPAFERLVEDHFRYYQFYGNTALAALFAFAAWSVSSEPPVAPSPWPELALFTLEITLVAASRDALRRYYRRTGSLLALVQETPMTNGSHHPNKPGAGKPDAKKPAADAKKPANASKKS